MSFSFCSEGSRGNCVFNVTMKSCFSEFLENYSDADIMTREQIRTERRSEGGEERKTLKQYITTITFSALNKKNNIIGC